MLPVPPRRRRARPVADAPIDALLPRSEDLAKGWLLALLEQAPLDDAPVILGSGLTRDGPRLCDAVLRAIADETDLRRLQPGGALTSLGARVGELAGADGAPGMSRAVDALHAVVWAAIRDELRSPDADLISELTERLTLVSEVLRTAALERLRQGGGSERELAAVPLRGDPPLHQRAWPAGPAASAGPPEALWVGALDAEIQRGAGYSLSLLLAELEDVERVSVVEDAATAGRTYGNFGAAVRSAVRRQDILVCETDVRAWIIARDTGRPGAHALGERIAEAVRKAQPWRGAPLTASVGVAVLGEDGLTSADLIEAAEEARFAAAADGVDVVGSTPEQDG